MILLAFGTFWFWAVVVVSFLLLVVAIDYENNGWATFDVIIAATVLAYANHFNVFGYLRDNLLTVGLFLVGYALVGTLVATAKWYFYNRKIVDQYNEEKLKLLRQREVESLEQLVEGDRQWLFERTRIHTLPLAADSKGKLIAWLTYWPGTAVTLFDEPFKRAAQFIYRRMAGVWQSISDHMFRDIKKDMETHKLLVKQEQEKRWTR